MLVFTLLKKIRLLEKKNETMNPTNSLNTISPRIDNIKEGMGILNPPNIPAYKSPLSEDLNARDTLNIGDVEKSLNIRKKKTIMGNISKILILAGTVVLLGVMAKKQLAGMAKPITSIAELEKHVMELGSKVKVAGKKLNIQFHPEKYIASLENKTKGCLDLDANDIALIRALPERQNDIKKALKGALETIRRSGKTQKLIVTLDRNLPNAKKIEETLNKTDLTKDILTKTENGQYIETLVGNIVKIETAPIRMNFLLKETRNPALVEIRTPDYIQTGQDNFIRKMYRNIIREFF